MNLVQFILQSPGAHTACLAEVDGTALKQRLAFPDIKREIAERAATFRALSSSRGKRFFVAREHGLDFALDFLACIAAGQVAVPLSPALTASELQHLATRFKPAAVLSTLSDLRLPSHTDAINPDDFSILREKERRHAPHATVAREPEDPAWMVFTSGTSAEPRGVVHANRSVRGRIPMDNGWTGIHQADVILHTGQLNWTFAMGLQVLDAIRLGATSVIHTGDRSPDAWGTLVKRWQVSVLAGVPSVFRRILKHDPQPARFSTLRTSLCAGEALPESVDREWFDATGGALHEAFGMSECSTFISTGPEIPKRPGSPGRPQAGRRIAILDQSGSHAASLPPNELGLLAVHRSDPGLMLGYADDPLATDSAFRGEWFVSGDLGWLDEDGYFHFRGRASEVINPMGHRVSPLEVEAALRRAPGIRDAAVAETEVRPGVSIIGALIVPDLAQPFSPEQVKAWMDLHLAHWKQPGRYRLVDDLPRSANGKVRRREVDPMLRADGRSFT